jgi:hypothetical protein
MTGTDLLQTPLQPSFLAPSTLLAPHSSLDKLACPGTPDTLGLEASLIHGPPARVYERLVDERRRAPARGVASKSP